MIISLLIYHINTLALTEEGVPAEPPINFPWLTGEDYWRGQTATFLEQVKVLQEPPLQ
jgi:Ser/Thr protein kinase RdoA (MazF antagonist)